MRTDLVMAALTMASGIRNPGPGLLHHSDRGSQYASRRYQEALKAAGMICSMSRKGNCYDNAVQESGHHTLKTELAFTNDSRRERRPSRRSSSTLRCVRFSMFSFLQLMSLLSEPPLPGASPPERRAPPELSSAPRGSAIGKGRPFPKPHALLTSKHR